MKKLLLLTFLPIFGLLLSNNCFALKHNYDAMSLGGIILPPLVQDSNNKYYYDFTSNSFNASNYVSSSLTLGFDSSLSSEFNDSKSIYGNNFYYLSNQTFQGFSLGSNSTICNVYTNGWYPTSQLYDYYKFDSNIYFQSGSSSFVYLGGRSFFPDGFSPISNTYDNSLTGPCYDRFARENGYTFNFDSNHQIWASSSPFNGTLIDSGPIHHISEVDVLELEASTYTNSGVEFTHKFSFDKIFKNGISKFTFISIPLQSWDGYFLKSENLYQGRQLEWKFSFNFSSFEWGDNTLSNGTLELRLGHAVGSDGVLYDNQVPSFRCTSETINSSSVDSTPSTQLLISCPVTLNRDYAGFFPYLYFSTSSGFVFNTNDSWDFSGLYLITDDNSAPGDSFNSTGHAGLWSPYNGEDSGGSADFFSSLSGLFSFTINSTPLGLIFGGFSDLESCASIPTIASMLNSNETEVCPFFPSSVRSITTPVLALFSAFLLFGAFMSWLGGSSGNFIEDSSTHTWGGFKIAKGGKK